MTVTKESIGVAMRGYKITSIYAAVVGTLALIVAIIK